MALGITGIVTWSERAILWKGIAKPTAESMDLRKTIVLDRRDLDARDARIASLEATNASLRAKHADETARTKAHLTAEIETLAALVASRDARMEEHEGGNKRLARSDRYHNGPHSPSSTNSWSSERHKEAAARKNARQAKWRRPGRGAGHPGVTRKMDTCMPVERRRPQGAADPGSRSLAPPPPPPDYRAPAGQHKPAAGCRMFRATDHTGANRHPLQAKHGA